MTMDRVGLGEMKKLAVIGGTSSSFTLIPGIAAKSAGLRSLGHLGRLVNEYNVTTARAISPAPPPNRSVATLQWPPKRGASTPDINDRSPAMVRGTLMRDGAVLGMDALQGMAGVVADQSAILKGIGPGYGIQNFVSSSSKGVTYSGNTAQLRHDGDTLILTNPPNSSVNAVFATVLRKEGEAARAGGVTLKPGESKKYYVSEGGTATAWPNIVVNRNVDMDVTLVDTPPSSTEAARVAEEKRLQDALAATNARTDIDATTKANIINDLQNKLAATQMGGVGVGLQPYLPWLVVGGVAIGVLALIASRK